MKTNELIWARRYAEAIAELRQDLAKNPEDMTAVERMAKALRAAGEHREALSFFQHLEIHDKSNVTANTLAPGRAAWQIDVACLHWLVEDRSTAVRLMHGLAAGILDRSIRYADAAGGVSQGLLLYYIALTENSPSEVSFALDYLKNRVKRSVSHPWPSPVAQFHLGEIPFEKLMEEVDRQPNSPLLDRAKAELGRRRRLTVALFHDGVRSRALGDQEHCLSRMRDCYGLENPILQQEWYLARHEVQKAYRE